MRFHIQKRPSLSTSSGIGAKILGSLFFLVFFAAGAAFTYWLAKDFLHTVETRSWTKTPTNISSVSIRRNQKHDEDTTPYELSLTYSYFIDSQKYTKTLSPNEYRFALYEEANEIVQDYTSGKQQYCYVNPDEPNDSVLWLRSLWSGLLVFFPLIFVAVGLGGLYSLWLAGDKKAPSISRRSIARSARQQSSSDWVMWVVGGVFSAFGLAGTWYFADMGLQVIGAQSWKSHSAKVLESSIIRHRSESDDGGVSYTYSLDVFYEYEADGKTFRASRFSFSDIASSGLESKKRTLADYPKGKVIEIFLNPDDPSQAIIEKGFSWFFLFILFPLVFLIIGLALLFSHFSSKESRSKKAKHPIVGTEGKLVPPSQQGPVTLKPAASPLGKVIGILLICLFWNGIVSVFVFQAFEGWLSGNIDWFLTLFMIPFVLVGLALIVGLFYSFLAFFNPVVELTVNTQNPSLGSTLEIEWRTKGNAHRMSELALSIQGIEQVTYRRGTNTRTEKHTFFEQEITRQSHGPSIQRGSIQFQIPRNQMHSFEANSNKILWQLSLRGDIPKWPDVSDTFQLNVQPVGES